MSLIRFDDARHATTHPFLENVRGTIVAHLQGYDGRVSWDRARRAIIGEIDNPAPEPPDG